MDEEEAKEKQAKGSTRMKCTHGPNQRCPNCFDEDEGKIRDRKHEPFDMFVEKLRREKKLKLKTWDQTKRYTVDYNCKFHPPYPQGSCHRCIPSSVILTR